MSNSNFELSDIFPKNGLIMVVDLDEKTVTPRIESIEPYIRNGGRNIQTRVIKSSGNGIIMKVKDQWYAPDAEFYNQDSITEFIKNAEERWFTDTNQWSYYDLRLSLSKAEKIVCNPLNLEKNKKKKESTTDTITKKTQPFKTQMKKKKEETNKYVLSDQTLVDFSVNTCLNEQVSKGKEETVDYLLSDQILIDFPIDKALDEEIYRFDTYGESTMFIKAE